MNRNLPCQLNCKVPVFCGKGCIRVGEDFEHFKSNWERQVWTVVIDALHPLPDSMLFVAFPKTWTSFLQPRLVSTEPEIEVIYSCTRELVREQVWNEHHGIEEQTFRRFLLLAHRPLPCDPGVR